MKWHVQNHWAVTCPGFLILCPEPPALPYCQRWYFNNGITRVIIVIIFSLRNCMRDHVSLRKKKKVNYLNSYLIGTSGDIETPTIIYSICEYMQPSAEENGPIPKLFHLAESVPAVVHT